MGIRRPSVSKKFGKHRYAILESSPLGYDDAQRNASVLRRTGKSVRVLRTKAGYFIYYYPQYPSV